MPTIKEFIDGKISAHVTTDKALDAEVANLVNKAVNKLYSEGEGFDDVENYKVSLALIKNDTERHVKDKLKEIKKMSDIQTRIYTMLEYKYKLYICDAPIHHANIVHQQGILSELMILKQQRRDNKAIYEKVGEMACGVFTGDLSNFFG